MTPIVHHIAAVLLVLFAIGALVLANHFWRDNERLRSENARLKERLGAPRSMPKVKYLGEYDGEKHGQDAATALR